MEANKAGITLTLKIVQTRSPPQGLGSEAVKGPIDQTHTYSLPIFEIQNDGELDQKIESIFPGAKRQK